MELKEKEGTIFVNKQTRDQRARSLAAIVAAAVFGLFMLAVIALVVWAEFYDPIPLGVIFVVIAIPIAMIVGLALALRQRLKEIKGGEEDAARNY